MTYRKNGKISGISEISRTTGATFLFDEVMAGIKNIIEERPTAAVGTLQPFLKEFLDKLIRSTQKEGIEIVSIEEKPYRLRVVFEEDGDERILDFVYDGKKRWKQIQEVPVGGKNHGFKERVRSFLEGGVGSD